VIKIGDEKMERDVSDAQLVRAGILDGLREPKRPIGLVFETGLSLRSLRTHLEPLIENGLVEERRDERRRAVYALTPTGAENLSRMYKRLRLEEEKERRRKSARRVYAVVFVLCALLAVDVSMIVVGLLRTERYVPGTGRVVVPPPPPPPPVISFQLYWDEACTQPVSEIDWGELEPGDSRTVNFYVVNDGDVSLTMDMNVTDWTPVVAEKYLVLIWEADGAVVAVGELRMTSMTLTVSAGITGVDSFSMTIMIAGTET
jgi:DNA-binding transcriptional ArsR family regulator